MHYYDFNIADYRKDTGHLTPIEHYIYRTLIDWYYLDEKPIPKNNPGVLRRLCLGIEMEPNLLNVLNDFFKLGEKGWQHARIDVAISDYHALLAKNQTNGRLGGRPRKTQSVISGLGLANPNVTQTKGKPVTNNHKPVTNNHIKPSTASKLADADCFAKFWHAYPKKTAKDTALKAWAKIQDKPAILAACLAALAWQKQSEQWQKDDGNFIPYPATYLNQSRWLDEPPVLSKGYRPLKGAKFDPVAFVNNGREEHSNGQIIDHQ